MRLFCFGTVNLFREKFNQDFKEYLEHRRVAQ
jgi:hypothetical protein